MRDAWRGEREDGAGEAGLIDSPQAWLARLAELKRQGRSRELRDALAEFKKRYPSYPVPAGLEAPE